MTTGEKLVELSTLSTGTAEQHLLAIVLTGGGGPGGAYYIPTPEVIGEVVEDFVLADLELNNEILATLPEVDSDGLLIEDKVAGEKSDEELKGTVKCP